ncbi:hypothetical protein BKA67DRAFT_124756 [Truncatella angustata]|uniref:Uncharacterized protein n=1 Tax=Truncatella angustata TaxID=152316 RepID=A0A9P8RKN9_9PEZI|nr:uncharacterized protein BKA67DRAFT_124756 [Truncatella angustata]KAH6644921.1 hypothetical protein BKA67DRAFT_124756 [Truncatella angustata]
MLLQLGACDTSWKEHGESCLHMLLKSHYDVSVYYARRFIEMGADPCEQSLVQLTLSGYDLQSYSGYHWNLLRLFCKHGARLRLDPPTVDEGGFKMPKWLSPGYHPLVFAIESARTEKARRGIIFALDKIYESLSNFPEIGYHCFVAASHDFVYPGVIRALLAAGVQSTSLGRRRASNVVGRDEYIIEKKIYFNGDQNFLGYSKSLCGLQMSRANTKLETSLTSHV